MSDRNFMRISVPTVLVSSTLMTLVLYQGYVTFFSNADDPDDGSAASTTKGGAKSEQETIQQTGAIAAPETIAATNGIKSRVNVPMSPQQLAANRSAVARGGLPTVNVPPRLRSLPTRVTERPALSSSATQNAPDRALPETIAIKQSKPDVAGTQSLPFTSVSTSLSDVEGHWAESYIESLAAKGVVRGFSDGSFRPDDQVTSRQFVLMTQKAFTVAPVSYNDLQQLHPDRTPTRADAVALIYQTLAKEKSAPLTMAVQVSGAVPRPGIYAIANGSRIDAPSDAGLPTVSRAIQQAGGALEGADLHQVQIHRIGENSARQVINVDVQQSLQAGDRRGDLVLQQGDKLVIPTAASASDPRTNVVATPESATSASNPMINAVATPERSMRLAERTK